MRRRIIIDRCSENPRCQYVGRDPAFARHITKMSAMGRREFDAKDRSDASMKRDRRQGRSADATQESYPCAARIRLL